jgi:hypothetical protein
MEIGYRRLAREKRLRLGAYPFLQPCCLLISPLLTAAGKGVKKNGLYIHDRAASFDSLPPGPDPKSVARDIHQILPKLTKKGTFFKPSQATIDQRVCELQALVDALFAEDVPTLVKELTSDRTLIDFFGYWRQDFDLDAKSKGKEAKPSSKARYSISSSVFSMYFNSSSHSTSQLPSPHSSMVELPTSPPLPQRRLVEPEGLPRPVSTTTISSSHASSAHGSGERDVAVRPPMPNLVSSNSSPAASTLDSMESLAVTSPIIVTEEFPIILDHSSDYGLDHHHTYDRPWVTLEALPEGDELKTPLSGVPFVLEGGDGVPFPGQLSRRAVIPDGNLLRNAKAFRPPPHSPPYTPPQSPLSKVLNPGLPEDVDRSCDGTRPIIPG